MLLLLTSLFGCASGCANSRQDSTVSLDSDCDTATVPFDECGVHTNEHVASRLLVDRAILGEAVTFGVVTIVRSQTDLDAFWETSGLAASGEAVPGIDFGTEQVVAYGFIDLGCKSTKGIAGFYVSGSDSTRWVAEVAVTCVFASCDTVASPALNVWATPIGDIDLCERGEECQGCP